jgi:hypothetical protein
MSVPLSLPWNKVQLFKRRFREDLFDVTLWDRKEYHPEYYRNAPSVVFLLPDFEWGYDIDVLPNGVKREIREAIHDGKKIYLGYITSAGDYKIYNAEVDEDEYAEYISGIKGTADKIFEEKVEHLDLSQFKSPGVYIREGMEDFSGSMIQERDSYAYAVKASYDDLVGDRRLLLLM